ncbi:hypothetical protein N9381_08620 [Paracoccaceae bacterium]|nr:hypothetical protein [Paracoccaceae bacterium]
MAVWYNTPKLKGAPSGRAISADNFIPEDKKSVSIFIREVFQNILDARKIDLTTGQKEQAIVQFTILTEGDKIPKGVHEKYLKDLEPFIDVTELSDKFHDAKRSPSALVFEETNTVGLTGRSDDSDCEVDGENERWNLFWHSDAKESKGLGLLGRAGQGKITYNLNSASGTIFALTDQEGGEKNLLFGKTRFPGTFSKDDVSYSGHAFFCIEGGDKNNVQPLPIKDTKAVDDFKKDFKLRRSGGSGTSWVIPYIDKALLNKNDLIRATISEFYLAILKGELVVDIEGEIIDLTTLRALVETYKVAETNADHEFLIWLIDASLKPPSSYTLDESWFSEANSAAEETCLGPVDLDDARKRYHLGETIHFSIPISFQRAYSGSNIKTFGDMYLKKIDGSSTKEIYARDCLIIEKEKHLKRAPGQNFGAFIANEDELNAFLGDADHASHLTWNAQNPRLKKNYNGYQTALSAVRSSMPAVAKLISSLDQDIYDDLFNDLLSVPIKKGTTKKTKKRKKGGGKIGTRVKRVAEYVIENPDSKTIKIISGPAFSLSSSSRNIQVKFAYENFATKGDPFSFYHRYDFEFEKFKSSNFTMKNCTILSCGGNTIELEVTSKDFEIVVSGFDPHECRVEVTDV